MEEEMTFHFQILSHLPYLLRLTLPSGGNRAVNDIILSVILLPATNYNFRLQKSPKTRSIKKELRDTIKKENHRIRERDGPINLKKPDRNANDIITESHSPAELPPFLLISRATINILVTRLEKTPLSPCEIDN